jgi:SAM-dependent methyltransferase
MQDRTTDGVHAVAARGFGAEAAAYERSRPSYPSDAVSWLADRLGVGPGRRVVDLAAGTGKLTRLLVPLGAQLLAIEPVAGMRAQLRRGLPTVPLLAGTAEALPLADASVDAVTVAQAFHWFDAGRAMTELGRVVRPGGALCLIWNARERQLDWIDQVWSVLDEVERHAPWREHGDGTRGPGGGRGWSERSLEPHDDWSPFTRATFWHAHQVTPDQVVERMLSVSHVAVLAPQRQAEVLERIRSILGEHPDTAGAQLLGIPYRVDVSVTERRSARPIQT